MNKQILYKITGIVGLLGCFAVLLTDIIGIIVNEKHNPIDDTISMLAIGPNGWIQDLGIDFFAAGFIALAIGLYAWKKDGTRWLIGLGILVLIGADLFMIAEHNQYAGDKEDTLHRKLVWIMAGLFLFINMLLYPGLQQLKPYLKKLCYWVGGLWLVFAFVFPLIPDSIEGAYERIVCVLLVVWPAAVSYELYQLGRTK